MLKFAGTFFPDDLTFETVILICGDGIIQSIQGTSNEQGILTFAQSEGSLSAIVTYLI